MASDIPGPNQPAPRPRIPALDPRSLGTEQTGPKDPTHPLPTTKPAEPTAAVPAATAAGSGDAYAAQPPPAVPAGRRWSGRRTAAAAGLALVLGGAGAVAVAAALPDGSASADVGDRSGRTGWQPPGRLPGANDRDSGTDGGIDSGTDGGAGGLGGRPNGDLDGDADQHGGRVPGGPEDHGFPVPPQGGPQDDVPLDPNGRQVDPDDDSNTDI